MSVRFCLSQAPFCFLCAAVLTDVFSRFLSDNPENETTLADNGKKTDAIWTVAQADFGIEGYHSSIIFFAYYETVWSSCILQYCTSKSSFI